MITVFFCDVHLVCYHPRAARPPQTPTFIFHCPAPTVKPLDFRSIFSRAFCFPVVGTSPQGLFRFKRTDQANTPPVLFLRDPALPQWVCVANWGWPCVRRFHNLMVTPFPLLSFSAIHPVCCNVLLMCFVVASNLITFGSDCPPPDGVRVSPLAGHRGRRSPMHSTRLRPRPPGSHRSTLVSPDLFFFSRFLLRLAGRVTLFAEGCF